MLLPVDRVLVIKMLYPMVKAVASQNINVTALGFESGVGPHAEEGILRSLPKNVKFIPLNFERGSKKIGSLKLISQFARVIREEKPDIVHVNALQDLVLVYLAVHSTLSLKKKPALVVMTHNPETWCSPSKARLAASTIRLFADGFVALATTNKNQLINLGFPKNKVIVIPNPFDPGQVNSEKPHQNKPAEIADKTIRIIYIANICERKAQDKLIRAFASVLKSHPQIKLDLLGKELQGEEEFIEKVHSLVKELAIQDQVNFHGLVPFQEAMDRLENSTIFVFPTLSEMMPRAVIEAMLAGKPIIASSVDGILDLIQNRKTGLLVQPGNEEELANAICELIENPAFAEALGAAGREYVKDFCSPDRVGHLFQEFYQSIINERHK